MKTINYDFSNFERIMSLMKSRETVDNSILTELKNELNKFYKDSKCSNIIFTKNTDKLFFGMCVIPYINNEVVAKILGEEQANKRIDTYYIEIDSKLLELGLTNRELVAVLLHEVGHMVNNTDPLNTVQTAVHKYVAEKDEILNTSKLSLNLDMFGYAIQDAVRNLTSIFRKTEEEIKADEFAVYCGFGNELESAYRKIVRKSISINKAVPNKFVTLQWVLRIYREMGVRRIYAIKTLNKAIDLTGSQLEKKRMNDLKKTISNIKPKFMIEESVAIIRKANDLYKKIKYKGIRSIEDELYEYSLRAKNVDEHDEALILIRQINSRISIIDDYMNTEKNLSQSEKERWFDLLNKYRALREELSKKTTYDEKFYGLFVQMPNVKSRYEI